MKKHPLFDPNSMYSRLRKPFVQAAKLVGFYMGKKIKKQDEEKSKDGFRPALILALISFLAADLSAAEIVGYQKFCNGRKCWFVPIYAPEARAVVTAPTVTVAPSTSAPVVAAAPMPVYATFAVEPPMEPSTQPLATGDAAHTPTAEVVRVLALLPKPQVAFVDYGCGYDARWCVAAAEKWKCKCVGVELDSRRARAARERVRNLGLDHLVTIVEGDAATVSVSGDVAVAYLYPDVLARVTPKLKRYRAFASYIHQPPGVVTVKSGDAWIYQQPQVQVQTAAPLQQQQSYGAVWGGQTYSGPLCNNLNCAMCNSIRMQLGIR